MSEQLALAGKTVLVVGGTKYLGWQIARRAHGAGAHVVIAGRDCAAAAAAAATLADAHSIELDVTDENSITGAAEELGAVDHIVVTAASPDNVPVTELEHDSVVRAFEAKVIGPMLLAKHLSPQIAPSGSMVLFSGIAAWKPAPGYTVMGITNGAVSFAVRHLAKELAPIRVNAVSPGIVDSGKYDAMSPDDKRVFFDGAAAGTLAGRIGGADDVVDAVMWLLTAGFVSGETIHVEGGARHF